MQACFQSQSFDMWQKAHKEKKRAKYLIWPTGQQANKHQMK